MADISVGETMEEAESKGLILGGGKHQSPSLYGEQTPTDAKGTARGLIGAWPLTIEGDPAPSARSLLRMSCRRVISAGDTLCDQMALFHFHHRCVVLICKAVIQR